jgi:hypothetical protein
MGALSLHVLLAAAAGAPAVAAALPSYFTFYDYNASVMHGHGARARSHCRLLLGSLCTTTRPVDTRFAFDINSAPLFLKRQCDPCPRWSNLGLSSNLTQLARDHEQFGVPGMLTLAGWARQAAWPPECHDFAHADCPVGGGEK